MMLCANAVLSKQKAAVFGETKQVLKSRVDTWGVVRNNLVFSALSLFRVEGSVTLKMLNLFIINQ